jgi:hypothetical protein
VDNRLLNGRDAGPVRRQSVVRFSPLLRPGCPDVIWRTHSVSGCRMSCVACEHCTTRQLNTHSIDSRQIHYPWHPWQGQTVWIRRSSLRVGYAVFHRSLEPTCATRLLEIPQWMFDVAAVCLMRIAVVPFASCEALRELKGLLLSTAVTGAETVIQATHQSLSRTGGSDAKLAAATASPPCQSQMRHLPWAI